MRTKLKTWYNKISSFTITLLCDYVDYDRKFLTFRCLYVTFVETINSYEAQIYWKEAAIHLYKKNFLKYLKRGKILEISIPNIYQIRKVLVEKETNCWALYDEIILNV